MAVLTFLLVSLFGASPPASLEFRALAVLGANNVPVATATVLSKQLLLTNAHVVAKQRTVLVRCVEKDIPGTVLGVAARTDLALISLKEACGDAVPSELADAREQLGHVVWIVGFPAAFFSVTAGIISTYQLVHMTWNNRYMMAGSTDATIERGNSGSPVINEKGQLVGIITGRTCPQQPEATLCKGSFTPIDAVLQFVADVSEGKN